MAKFMLLINGDRDVILERDRMITAGGAEPIDAHDPARRREAPRPRLMSSARWAAIGCAGILLAGCGEVRQDADTEAARVADHVLPGEVGNVLASSGASTPQQRGAAAEAWLSEPDPAVTDSQGGATWAVRSREGTSIRVDVYKWWESGSFFPPDQGEAAWGLACRSYDVAAEVTVRQVDCPEGTPEVP